MLQKSIFLLVAIKVALISSQASLSCNFQQTTPAQPYTCYLTINNPDGQDDFTSIPGEHLPNLGNDDVTAVSAAFQNTRNIPSVICQQFPNLVDLYMSSNEIEDISESSFAGCTLLTTVTLVFNNIRTIPENTFRNNVQLATLNMGRNSIESLSADSFTGSALSSIDLSYNQLGQFDQAAFDSIAETLTTLFLLSNQITTLPERAFANLRNLQSLQLSGNQFTSIPNNAFEGLNNLDALFLIATGLSEPSADWFADLRSLREIHLEANLIVELPYGLFGRSRRLTNVFLAGNNLTEVTPGPFGTNLPALEILSVIGNAIRGIDSLFFDSAENLQSLFLNGNICSNSNFEIDFNRRFQVREALERCFRGFGPEFIRCNYEVNIDNDYACHIAIRNPLGLEFDNIEGEHLSGQGNNNVLVLDINEGNTRNVPQIICQQFPQLTALLIRNSYLQIINTQSFSGCANLERVNLGANIIMEIPDNTFSNSPRLTEFVVGRNQLSTIHPNALAGTAVSFLALSDNDLGRFDPAWVAPISATLRNLDLIGTGLSSLPDNAFAGLTGLTGLFLNLNVLSELNGNIFAPLVNLEDLGISHNILTDLNPEWFSTLTNLRRLSIGFNMISEFPSNIFDSLVNLEQISFHDNRIVELRADSFGASLSNLRVLYGSRNFLNSFDDSILEQAGELDSLLFADNLCTDLYQHGIRGDLEVVRQRLETCRTNFQSESTLSCQYDRMITGRIYWCQLTINNPLGLNDFDRIEGTHLPGSDDTSVMYLLAENQNTRIIPTVICRQFPSLQILDLIRNNIDDATISSFEDCDFLRELMITGNRFPQIPSRAFSGALNLVMLFLSSNGIRNISPFAFEGTRIETLDLSHNEIREFHSSMFDGIGDTLRNLVLTDNRIEILPSHAFDRLTNLVDLEMNGNLFTTIPFDEFLPLPNLEILQMSNCRIQRIQPNLFAGLLNLRDLELSLNEINKLPENIFNLPNLQTLGLDGNDLRVLDAASFGQSLGSLLSIDVSINRIAAVDPAMVGEDSNIINLNLAYNFCVDLSFGNIPDFREEVLNRLEDCISAYNDVPISCSYRDAGEARYVCDLTIDNPVDRLTFDDIAGDHLEGNNDINIRIVEAVSQNSRSIPRIICQKFISLESLTFADSNVEVLTEETFHDCGMLFSLNLAGNHIVGIPERIFVHSPYLSVLNLANNQIERLRPEIFEGTQISVLDLELNRLSTFDPTWFRPLENTLRYLFLHRNGIRQLPRNAFSQFRQLAILELNGNEGIFIPSNAFNGLSHLFILQISGCGIQNLNPRWFDDLRVLGHLEVDSNEISVLPTGIFDLPFLQHLGIAFNQISVLDSASFGPELGELVTIDAEFNMINAIDRRLIENASALTSLSLVGNFCTDLNFIDVQENLEAVMEQLQNCFEYFETR